ncbi:MAG: cyclodeaminase/cyclohydrolase family protein [Anaerolineae bacterium]
MPFSDKTIQEFIDELASPSPAPGGGAAAALSGALGAALVAMVCRLTVGRKNYENVSDELEALIPRAESKRRTLMELFEADSAAYDAVIATYKLPKETEQDKAARTVAIQSALKRAAEVPFHIASACADVLDMDLPVAAKGNKNAASDAGSAALLAEAGLRAALLNVEINLAGIKDEAYVQEMRTRLAPFKGSAEQKEAILRLVQSRL